MGVQDASESRLDELEKLVRERVSDARADTLVRFVRRYHEGVPPEDVAERSAGDLYGAALGHWNLADHREPGTTTIRVFTPELEQDGWQCPHSVVEVVVDDMPFLVDSVTMALTRRELGIHLVVHPVLVVRRADDGRLLGLADDAGDDRDAVADGDADDSGPADGRTVRESFLRVEFDRQSDAEVLASIEDDLRSILTDVRVAVEDWRPMRDRLATIIDELEGSDLPVPDDDRDEALAFLRWVHDDHFTFLGYRSYELETEDDDRVLRAEPDTGLGILRQGRSPSAPKRFSDLPAEVRDLALEKELLILTKANSRATVHRPAYLDYVGIKRFDDDGEIVGEWRFLGLYTSAAYNASPTAIPRLRQKVHQVLERTGFRAGSHDHKDVLAILESYPRDELFQARVDELYRTVMGVHDLQERRQVRLFLRRDTYGRYDSALVYLPRDRYDTSTRVAMQRIMLDELGGHELDHSAHVSESVLARLHFIVHGPERPLDEVDVGRIEQRLAAAARDWSDALHEALVDLRGEDVGIERYRRYAEAFPAGYRGDTSPRLAVRDVDRLESLTPDEPMAMTLYRPLEAERHHVRFKLYHLGDPIPLSRVLPVLENLGVEVLDQRPYEVRPDGAAPCWIFDFGLDASALGGLDGDGAGDRFTSTFAAVWNGQAEDDTFNHLVLAAGLGWREVAVLRAYARYLRQVGSQFSNAYMAETLAQNGDITRRLVDLFRYRFDPRVDGDRGAGLEERTSELTRGLDALQSLDEDRILRGFLRLIEATLRTNFAQAPEGLVPEHLSFKFDPQRIPDLPQPRPHAEIWVYSPRAEGVHLRGGPVARGGIRWSDRREDFRTEILGLMKAQMVKNAVIVPHGAKGGFVVKRMPDSGDREEVQREVVECYSTLMRGMLDITDNLVDGEVVPPDQVVRYDGDDPYLVVAADKGTATFSDIANGIAEDYGFWLGDAFASGGSVGFDHKEMGITARGAWESVKRHFRELGTDVQSTDFTVVGIGDMSGDVFGNGMLLSRHIRLIGAFNHRHIFLDPDPDAERSYEERQRLFELPRSSWDDYDAELISEGGGVWSRTTRSVPVSERAAEVLHIEPGDHSPNEVIKAILRAPVDLLWNGGIGTYVKSTHENDADVGDKTNDAVRVDAADLRCRVIGEGGNLGVTQRGRIEFALAGGHVNTDAIDNSAGVDTSDHEVNIKILLNQAVDDGDMTAKQRNRMIEEMTEEVAEVVLRDNIDQNQALSSSVANNVSMLRVHRRYLQFLEANDILDRDLEALPDDETLAERASNDEGLTRPEFAVLLPYTKNWLQDRLLESDVPDDPDLASSLVQYFPTTLREQFRDRMTDHRLRRQIVTTQVSNDLVNHNGTTFVFRLMEETGAEPPDIVRAQTVARELYDLPGLWRRVESLDHQVPARVQTEMLLEGRRVVERASRWLLRHRSRPLDISGTVAAFQAGVDAVAGALPEALVGGDREAYEAYRDRLLDEGVPEDLAAHVAAFRPLFSALDITTTCADVADDATTAAVTYFLLGDELELNWVRDRIVALPRETRWNALARDALRDELYTRYATLTRLVLADTDPGSEPPKRIERWLDDHARPATRCRNVIGEIRASGRDSLTTLTVALRELRNLVEAAT